MDDPRRSPGPGDERAVPEPAARPAAAVAPPPSSPRALLIFVSALVAVVCGLAGVLLFFTPQPVWFAVLLLVLAVGAAVVLGVTIRKNGRGESG